MRAKRPTLLDVIYEHNYLNGLKFVFGEFVLMTFITAFVAAASSRQHAYLFSIVASGIAINTIVMLCIITRQLLNSAPSRNLLMNRSQSYREKVRKEYPDLTIHTAILSLALIIPFAIPVALTLQHKKISA